MKLHQDNFNPVMKTELIELYKKSNSFMMDPQYLILYKPTDTVYRANVKNRDIGKRPSILVTEVYELKNGEMSIPSVVSTEDGNYLTLNKNGSKKDTYSELESAVLSIYENDTKNSFISKADSVALTYPIYKVKGKQYKVIHFS